MELNLNAHGSSLLKCIGEIEENKALQPNAIKLTLCGLDTS